MRPTTPRTTFLFVVIATYLIQIAHPAFAEQHEPIRIATSACPEQKLRADDGTASDGFGSSVSFSSDTIVVGATYHDDRGHASGAVYVYSGPGAFVQTAKLLASDGEPDEFFGHSTAISDDTIIVGAHGDDDRGRNAGAAYIFVRSGSTWIEQAKLVPTALTDGDRFGLSVALSGETAIVGAFGDDDNGNNAGTAYVFVRTGATWDQQAQLLASDGAPVDNFGISVAIYGDTALVGADQDDDAGPYSGSAYVFERVGATWSEQAKLAPDDGVIEQFFGNSVSISGDTALVGAPKTNNIGLETGSAYVFVRVGITWPQQAKLVPHDAHRSDVIGDTVSLLVDRALIGSWRHDHLFFEGSSYLFVREGATWTEETEFVPSDGFHRDSFGRSVALAPELAVIGSPGDDDNGINSGSVYVYQCNQPPDCSAALPNPKLLWPPDHKFQEVTVLGVTDPDADPVAITIDTVFQDEPVLGKGDSTTSPDAIVRDETARIRSERSGLGDGRVYHIAFTARDGRGGSCRATLAVCVPHSQRRSEALCGDQGALHDSTRE